MSNDAPALDDILATARVVALPLAHRFRGVDVREAVVFEGPAGWTEFSPFAEYPDDEAAIWLAGAIDFGWRETPPARRTEIAVNATVPAVAASEVPAVLARFHGCRTAKVKVAERGQVLADDIARVRAVRAELGPAGRVRIDANGAWNVDEAEHAVHALAEFDLEYVEQPCASVDELAAVRRRVEVRVAADESIRRAGDPLRVARAEAADVAVLKVAPLGGVRASLRVAEQIGLPCVVSSAVESSVGLAAGLALAGALPELEFACGLGTADLLAGDVVATPLHPVAGVLPVPTRPPAPDPDLLARYAAEPATRDWWTARLARVQDLP